MGPIFSPVCQQALRPAPPPNPFAKFRFSLDSPCKVAVSVLTELPRAARMSRATLQFGFIGFEYGVGGGGGPTYLPL